MLRVSSIGAENLRSLANTGLIQLKPLTILVGRNSSGKSTFARLFPLLKQSGEAVKRGPLLWWGRLVDLGSFDDAISRQSTQRSIVLNFEIEATPDEFRSTSRRNDGRLSLLRLVSTGKVLVKSKIENGKEGAYVSNITIQAFGHTGSIDFDEFGFAKQISVGLFNWKPAAGIAFFAEQSTLFPAPSCYKAIPGTKQNEIYWEPQSAFRPEQSRLLRQFLHGNTAEEKVRQLADRIPIGTHADIFTSLTSISNSPSFRDNLLAQGIHGYNFQRLCEVSFASHLGSIFEQIGVNIAKFSEGVIYLEPLRANAQRYYRQQALAVGEIDSKGENIAMYLDNLNWQELQKLNSWMEGHFGIKVRPNKQGGHISLNIQQTGGGESNIADMGFGFSQMLPIAVQLWAASTKQIAIAPWDKHSRRPTVVIEQPELHLHPDYQAKLADVFVAALESQNAQSNNKQSSLNIIAETHSADLINRLGALVAAGKISADHVQVIVFEQATPQSSSTLTISEYDEDGVLTNWPVGFFTPSVYA